MIFAVDVRLRELSRMPTLALPDTRVRIHEIAVLLLLGGVASALTHLVRFRLGIPGHSIVLAIFPIALGFALVPRRAAGSVMGLSALATSALLQLGGVRLAGIGATTSLLLAGPMLDLALHWGRSGWRLYGAFVVGGAAANACAFAARAVARTLGMRGMGGGMGGGRGMSQWLPQAIWTYALAGVLAGLISAIAWFHLRERTRDGSGTQS
jgi:hypothetical protein